MNQYFLTRLNYYIDALNRFVKSDHAMMLIIGQHGSGKRELIFEFTKQLNDNFQVLELFAKANFEPKYFIEQLCQHWCLNLDLTLNSPRQQLDHLLTQIQQQQKSYVLIIHQAHTLNIATLAALSHLASRQEQPPIALHLIVCGEVELEDKMAGLLAQMPPSLLLQPLSKQETAQYIKYRLAKLNKGHSLTPSFSVIEEIYQQSGGFPSLINQLTQQWLYQQILEGNTKSDPSATNEPAEPLIKHGILPPPTFWQQHSVKFSATISLILLGAGLWFYNHHHLAPKPTSIVLQQPLPINLPLKSENLPTKSEDHPQNLVLASANNATSTLPPTQTLASEKATVEPPDPAVKQVLLSPKIEVKQFSPPIKPSPSNVHWKISTLKSPHNYPYTVQLFASHDFNAAKQFVNHYQLKTRAQIHYVTRAQQPWYVVTLGKYPSYAMASAATGALPRKLRQNNPWPRKLDGPIVTPQPSSRMKR